ncbi:NAD(P)/FAD-dependent oxidoreductase [Rhodohalobacter mucosus]|nr:FAD-dependent oxidoreductase [Rhodohalobacter mucosus]
MNNTYDFIIIGSGFGGSITAMCLVQRGFSVAIVEKDRHPRFAIGESSTPAADMILRDLAESYDLPLLKKLSRYGSWQKHVPEVVCGLKRGFSYYFHEPGQPFQSSRDHSRELLVAASTDDKNSDTNWLRSDVDQLLSGYAADLGADLFEGTQIEKLNRSKDAWQVQAQRDDEPLQMSASWILDATGSPVFAERFLGVHSSSDGFYTNSRAVYSHYTGAGRWLDYLNENSFYTDDYPYNPDHSALHQFTEEGWMWMLRFNNELLSAGFLIADNMGSENPKKPAEAQWQRLCNRYPSLKQIFRNSNIAARPGRIIQTGRLQRKLGRVFGNGWTALPHTAGFVDPLHSTGISFTLSGIRRLLPILEQLDNGKLSVPDLNKYEETVGKELSFMDMLVSSCYISRFRFDLFTASVMLYFAAVITWEQRYLSGNRDHAFLCPDIPDLYEMVSDTHGELLMLGSGPINDKKSAGLIERIRTRIEPFNRAGLMDPEKYNMYRHTAVTLS